MAIAFEHWLNPEDYVLQRPITPAGNQSFAAQALLFQRSVPFEDG